MRYRKFIFLKGFSLIELMLVVSIIAILAVLLVNIMASARIEARASKILDLTELIKHSCKMYESDTGSFAQVSTARPFDPLWQGLTEDDGTSGWAGPYMQEVLTIKNNPFDNLIWVSNIMLTDFDIDGNGAVDLAVGNNGNCVAFFDVPEKAARYVNDSLDRGIAGNWMSTGKAVFISGTPNRLIIYLIGGR